jgi:sarcosine oxidase
MIVVAAAGWSNRILDPLDLHVPLTVTREHVAYFPIRAGMTMLPFIWHDGGRFEYYGLPNGNTGDGKVGQHGAGPECDPDSEGIVDPARVKPVAQFVDGHLPGLQPVPESSETCLYASTPDDDFVIDRAGPVVIGMGFGGHGFKFGAVIGKLLADVAEGGRTEWSDRFSRARFWENAALR